MAKRCPVSRYEESRGEVEKSLYFTYLINQTPFLANKLEFSQPCAQAAGTTLLRPQGISRPSVAPHFYLEAIEPKSNRLFDIYANW
jgi:hypothetical protein